MIVVYELGPWVKSIKSQERQILSISSHENNPNFEYPILTQLAMISHVSNIWVHHGSVWRHSWTRNNMKQKQHETTNLSMWRCHISTILEYLSERTHRNIYLVRSNLHSKRSWTDSAKRHGKTNTSTRPLDAMLQHGIATPKDAVRGGRRTLGTLQNCKQHNGFECIFFLQNMLNKVKPFGSMNDPFKLKGRFPSQPPCQFDFLMWMFSKVDTLVTMTAGWYQELERSNNFQGGT